MIYPIFAKDFQENLKQSIASTETVKAAMVVLKGMGVLNSDEEGNIVPPWKIALLLIIILPFLILMSPV